MVTGPTAIEINFSLYYELNIIITCTDLSGNMRYVVNGIISANFLNMYGLDVTPLYWTIGGNYTSDQNNMAAIIKVTKNKIQLYSFIVNGEELKSYTTIIIKTK